LFGKMLDRFLASVPQFDQSTILILELSQTLRQSASTLVGQPLIFWKLLGQRFDDFVAEQMTTVPVSLALLQHFVERETASPMKEELLRIAIVKLPHHRDRRLLPDVIHIRSHRHQRRHIATQPLLVAGKQANETFVGLGI
jgi:hypothetical protein